MEVWKFQNDGEYSVEEHDRIRAGRAMAQEGMVLLENNGVLPLRDTATVAIFGMAQVNFLTGGSGSGATDSNYSVTLLDALRENGIGVNEKVASVYVDYCKKANRAAAEQRKSQNMMMTREVVPEMELPESLVAEAAAQSGTSVVVISRISGEGRDRTPTPGDWYLSDVEKKMLQDARSHFHKLVVILNIAGITDMNWVDEIKPDGVLIAWLPGMQGANAVADILTGRVNPSGKLTDTIANDYMDYPSSHNFGGFIDGMEMYTGNEDQVPYWGMIGNHAAVPVGETVERPVNNRWFVEYQEGVYVGYRYFETFNVPVKYPFGYGLSYTSFAITASGFKKEGAVIRFNVSVTNTGNVSGKEVVQIYYRGADGKLERPERELLTFEKTKTLKAGETQILSFAIDEGRMAAYSEEKASYILQEGKYVLYVGNCVKGCEEFASFESGEKLVEKLSNQVGLAQGITLRQLSKFDKEGSFPVTPAIRFDGGEKMERPGDTTALPASEVPAAEHSLKDVYDGKVRMCDFLKQATDLELVCLCIGTGMEMMGTVPILGELSTRVRGAAGQSATISRLGVPTIVMSDGPAGITASAKRNRLAFPVAQVSACSWNEELAEQLGESLGAEAAENMVDIWLAPALNIHRNPLCGRNYEYFAEDPVVSGTMAAAITRGAQKHNVGACLKHFAANNQETNRFDGVDSVVSERALREIYLKGFEIAVKSGRPWCVMTSYNSVNGIYAAARRDLSVNILRDEWGFDGFVVTDWEGDGPYSMEALQAGNDLMMPGFPGQIEYILGKVESGDLSRQALEGCAKNLLQVVMRSNSFKRYHGLHNKDDKDQA